MQQLWTFGYHQCRWGYRNWTHLQKVVDDFEKFEIPLETIWSKCFRELAQRAGLNVTD